MEWILLVLFAEELEEIQMDLRHSMKNVPSVGDLNEDLIDVHPIIKFILAM